MFEELELRKRNIIYIRAILTLIITLLGAYYMTRASLNWKQVQAEMAKDKSS